MLRGGLPASAVSEVIGPEGAGLPPAQVSRERSDEILSEKETPYYVIGSLA